MANIDGKSMNNGVIKGQVVNNGDFCIELKVTCSNCPFINKKPDDDSKKD
jgi:hypothetical protein